MKRNTIFIWFLLLVCWGFQQVYAQPLKGVVWDQPSSREEALKDLVEMKGVGVQVIRTGLIFDDSLLTLADSLQLSFFQELPIENLTANRLLELMPFARGKLSVALRRATRHPSARHFGLATNCDTSNPNVKPFFTSLMKEIKGARGFEAKGYYVTTLIETDKMVSTVDFVLLETNDEASPVKLFRSWKEHFKSKSGGIILGTWINPTVPDGYLILQSPSFQARYLETNLRALLDSRENAFAIFVNRWNNLPKNLADFDGSNQKTQYAYGIQSDSLTFPSFNVLKGFYSGEQTVFAFNAGEPDVATSSSWTILTGWLLLILLGFTFIQSIRFQDVAGRYFFAHKTYQDFVRRSREGLFGINIILLIIFAFCFGLVGMMWLELLQETVAFTVFLEQIENTFISTLANNPLSLVLLLGSLYILFFILLILLLYGVGALLTQTITLPKVFMTVVWSFWGILLVFFITLISVYAFSFSPIWTLLILLIVAFVIGFINLVQLNIDLASILQVSFTLPFIISLLLLALVGFGIYSYFSDMQTLLTYTWNLLLEEI